MTRFRFACLLSSLTLALALALATAPVQTAAARSVRLQAAPKTPAAEYVGSDTCLGCHVGLDKSLAQTTHGRKAHPQSPAAAKGCETCHGPGSRHLEDPSSDLTMRKFAKMAPRDTAETCLSCHTSSTHALWQGSAHDARNMSCVTCHSVHAPAEPKAQLVKASELELCATCHRPQALKIRRVSHMPVAEGKMACSTCHNPHGATNVKQLRTGNWINETCRSSSRILPVTSSTTTPLALAAAIAWRTDGSSVLCLAIVPS